MESELRRAIERGELELHYQPKVDLKTGRVVGAEALIRWRHPRRGLVSPADFIPLAEETGLIIPLGQWVLNTACQQVRTWLGSGLEPPRVSINVSSHQFRQRALALNVGAALREFRIGAGRLCLELTESAIMEHAEENVRILQVLKESGVALSIDDFGTGYSSLSYLKRFPIDEIKVDRSFVAGVHGDKDNAAIVTAVIAMAHSLGLSVVAEGVETPPELDFLLQLGCDECQGYLYSRPLPAADFGALLLAGDLPVLVPTKKAA
jgi:EAL domain-containing protein (putative c-di-GMP-specific phosphodiesterase class I)